MSKKRTRQYLGLKLLGNSHAVLPSSPQLETLEVFPNPKKRREYTIQIDCPNFTSLCPVTGQPDFAEIIVEYVPDSQCIETKSLKLYLGSYRNVHSFNETVVNRILDDLVRACQPRRMNIEARFVARGGLALTIKSSYPDANSEPISTKIRGKV